MADVLISMNRFASDYTNTFLYFGMTFDKSIEDILDIENFI